MKKVQVSGQGKTVDVLVNWDNILYEDCPQLKMKKGDSLSIFYRNHPKDYTYLSIPVYVNPYHPQEKLAYMVNKNKAVKKLIESFDLVLSV